MNPTEKPRSDSILKTLPEDRQSEIVSFATNNTIPDTLSWLEEAGIQISNCALSRFLSYHRLKEQIARNECAILTVIEGVSKKNPALDTETVYESAHIFFAGAALERQDPRAWYLMQQLSLHRAQSKLEAAKYHDNVEARKAAIQRELDLANDSGGITPETLAKIERELNLC
jgi:hypothetical protein